MKIPTFLERRFWERSYVDLWTVPHILMGVLAAIAFVHWSGNPWLGGLAVFFLAVCWEIFEYSSGIFSNVEAVTNRLTDILVALAGYGLGLMLFSGLSGHDLMWVAVAVLLIDALFTLMGIVSYRLSVAGRSEKA
jgi:hypothetical protein